MRNKLTIIILTILVGLIAGGIILNIDAKQSKDNPNENARDKSGIKEKAKAEREYIEITFSQLAELIDGIRNSQTSNFGTPTLYNDTLAMIDLSNATLSSIQDIIGSTNSDRFKDVYTPQNNLHFKTSIIYGDTIVFCPAYILAKLIDLYENE